MNLTDDLTEALMMAYTSSPFTKSYDNARRVVHWANSIDMNDEVEATILNLILNGAVSVGIDNNNEIAFASSISSIN